MKTVKKVLLAIGIVFLVLIIAVVVIYKYRIPIMEDVYKSDPTSENLIQLSIFLVNSKDYDRMMKYLPLAVELDDFIEVSESKELFIEKHESKTYAAENTYSAIIVESALSYIYAEKYDEFHEKFPESYKKIMINRAYSNWGEAMYKNNRITKEGYENIIKAIDENTPPPVEVTPENREKVREYANCLILKAFVFDGMGDKEKGNNLRNEYFKLLRELKTVMKK